MAARMPEWSDEALVAALSPAGDSAASPAGLRRREFLDLIARVVALPACKDKPRDEPAAVKPAPPAPPGALDAAAYRTLDAATVRILPGDTTFPSARDAGVIAFIDRQLAIA